MTGVYIAGDTSGIEEASTAMIEGKIAGLSAAISLGYKKKNDLQKIKQLINRLSYLRAGPFGEKSKVAKEKIIMLKRKTYDRL
jgi:hypothetical protein